MRTLAAAILAVPVLAALYIPVLRRRSVAARVGLAASVGIVVVVAALGLSHPVATIAGPPSQPVTALAETAFRSIATATDLHAGVDIAFSEPMDARSVAASLSVVPAVDVSMSWNAAGTILTVRPRTAWVPGTYQTITVEAGALAAAGRPMSSAARAAFVTRPATSGRIDPSPGVASGASVGSSASVGTAFRIVFDRPVSLDAVRSALSIRPAVVGSLVADPGPADLPATAAAAFTFTPATPLTAATTYRVSLAPLTDADGAAVAAVAATSIRTGTAPRIVRFRPAAATRNVARRSVLSVRFSEPMDHATTLAAFKVTANGAAVAGTKRFAESSTVLVFQPAAALPQGATVVVSVAATAMSASGSPLAAAASATVTVVPKAAPKPVTKPAPKPAPKPQPASNTGGGAVGGGSWAAVESYYLRLMNCTRTGGWVTSTGACSSPGGRNVAPLKLDAGISSRVSRPYARKLAINNLCTHFSGGNPGDRLRAAGYTSYRWAENIGCLTGNPYTAVLNTHIYFQNEKSSNGGHYVNMMNSAYDRVGIGVWVASGRVRLVIDFYHPL